jgi:hypothetical protein
MAAVKGTNTKVMDGETKAIIYEGVSVSQLGAIFGIDNRTVTRKINGLSPCGTRVGHAIYELKEAAAYLVDPKGDIGEYIKKMNHRDLPPLLLKEFWTGQNARLKFEEEQGDLWRTEKVIEHMGEVFKTLRMTILLTRDRVERETELTDRQRLIIDNIIDGALGNMHLALVEQFENDPDRTFDGTDDEQVSPDDDEDL